MHPQVLHSRPDVRTHASLTQLHQPQQRYKSPRSANASAEMCQNNCEFKEIKPSLVNRRTSVNDVIRRPPILSPITLVLSDAVLVIHFHTFYILDGLIMTFVMLACCYMLNMNSLLDGS